MLSRRLLWLIPVLLLIAACYSAWLAWQVRSDLESADSAARELQTALDDGSADDQLVAIRDLQSTARSAQQRTAGVWWGAMTKVPIVGDDAAGIEALSGSLDVLASEGVEPLADTADQLDRLIANGRIDVQVLKDIGPPVEAARAAIATAADRVEGIDSSGYAGSVRMRFDKYVDLVTRADDVLGSAETATQALPSMVGADGPRDYLLVFQNNAEIRATGGLPGSWAVIHSERGKLTMKQQGTGAQFGARRSPVLSMSDAELEVYDETMGIYFLSSNFTPDFPRAADLWAARWEEVVDGPELDGVLSLDPVAMSYLLRGTGPIEVAGRTIDSENAVDELLSRPYLELSGTAQDALFAQAAKAIFDATTGELDDPIEFVKGVARAAEEGRLLVAPFAEEERRALADTRVLGGLAGDDGETPHVDIGLNDATASKMSYYLRYSAEVRSESCAGDEQALRGSMSLSQSISPSDAAKLPDYVTGGGQYGNDPGIQLVFVRIYGPHGGEVSDIRMDGRALDPDAVNLDGRPVVTLIVELSTVDDVVINWSMQTGPGQIGDVQIGLTPSVVPGQNDDVVPSSC